MYRKRHFFEKKNIRNKSRGKKRMSNCYFNLIYLLQFVNKIYTSEFINFNYF